MIESRLQCFEDDARKPADIAKYLRAQEIADAITSLRPPDDHEKMLLGFSVESVAHLEAITYHRSERKP